MRSETGSHDLCGIRLDSLILPGMRVRLPRLCVRDCRERSKRDEPQRAHTDNEKENAQKHEPKRSISSRLDVLVSSPPPRGRKIDEGGGTKQELGPCIGENLKYNYDLQSLPF